VLQFLCVSYSDCSLIFVFRLDGGHGRIDSLRSLPCAIGKTLPLSAHTVTTVGTAPATSVIPVVQRHCHVTSEQFAKSHGLETEVPPQQSRSSTDIVAMTITTTTATTTTTIFNPTTNITTPTTSGLKRGRCFAALALRSEGAVFDKDFGVFTTSGQILPASMPTHL